MKTKYFVFNTGKGGRKKMKIKKTTKKLSLNRLTVANLNAVRVGVGVDPSAPTEDSWFPCVTALLSKYQIGCDGGGDAGTEDKVPPGTSYDPMHNCNIPYESEKFYVC
jgi:hypothetical protein